MEIFRKSRPYTIVADDAAQGRLSHAYLLLCPDAKNLRAFLKELAKPVACDGLEGAARARAERLIDEEMYADCRVFPAPGEKCGVAEVRDLLGDCIVKPREGRRKVFVLDAVQEMLAPAQNKLLKVLEEPPANVHFLLGSTNEFSVLPTVRSRVKKLELPAFSEADAEEYLRQKYPQRQDCRELAALSGGGAFITACEKNHVRAERLRYNLARQGAARVTVMECDARKLDEFFRFDKILLDAPCSGSGTVQAGPGARKCGFSDELLARSVKTQQALLRRALDVLAPGGVLVYATCSILSDENEGVLERVLPNSGAELEPLPEGLLEGVPLLPCRLPEAAVVCPTDLFEGFFVALVKKKR